MADGTNSVFKELIIDFIETFLFVTFFINIILQCLNKNFE